MLQSHWVFQQMLLEYPNDPVVEEFKKKIITNLQPVLKQIILDNDTTNTELNPFGAGSPLVSETYVIKSILVTSAGTPSVTVTNNAFTAIKTAALTANTTVELLTQPLIVVGGTTLTIKAGSADSFDFGVSYLNIKKEVTT